MSIGLAPTLHMQTDVSVIKQPFINYLRFEISATINNELSKRGIDCNIEKAKWKNILK